MSICHCGYPENFHNFRHTFTKVSEVKRTINEGRTCFEIDATNFPVVSKTKCGFPDCSAIKGFHDIKLVKHDFVPQTTEYKDVKIVLFGNEKCNVCSSPLEKHSENHSFTTCVKVLNKGENDKVSVIYYEDEDVKIIFS